MRRIISIALAAVIVASCGDALGGVGDLSHRVVYGDEVTTTTSVAPPESQTLRLRGITDLIWTNDGTDATTAGLDQDSVITAVGSAATRSTRSSKRAGARLPLPFPASSSHSSAPEAVTHARPSRSTTSHRNSGRIDSGGFRPLGGRAV